MRRIILAVVFLALFASLAHADIYVKAGDTIPLGWQANPAEQEVVKYTLLVRQILTGVARELATVASNGYVIRADDLDIGQNFLFLTATDAFENTSEESEPHPDRVIKDDGINPTPPVWIIWVVE